MIRIGHGFDVHAFGEDRPLIIGGIEVPYHTGFIAHSDGDVALHASVSYTHLTLPTKA